MPRHPRIHFPGAFYHVTLRGNHRQDIFFSPADRMLFTEISAEVVERFGSRLHAYCLMTNHVHLLIQCGDVPLGRLMLRIASRYARAVQARFHTTGHLFERRYHAVLVDADEYLLELLRYIHLNPVRAHMVTTVDDYPWSSHPNYLGERAESWLTTEFALATLHPEREHAIALYQQFINETVDDRYSSPLRELNPNDSRILGGDQFLANLLQAAWQPKSRQSLANVIDSACEKFNVTPTALASPSRQRHLTRVRAWIAHQTLILRISSMSEVARTFNRSEASLRESVKRHFNYP